MLSHMRRMRYAKVDKTRVVRMMSMIIMPTSEPGAIESCFGNTTNFRVTAMSCAETGAIAG